MNQPTSGRYWTIFILFAIILISGTQQNTKRKDEDKKLFYCISPFQLPEKLDFCGEPVPLLDQDVAERFDKELLSNAFWESSNLMHLKRMTRFFPMIEKILKEKNLPDDLKYLAVAESGLSGAVSPAGAAGLWQFMPETGKQYGLEINDEVDERYHPEKATLAACNYLQDLYSNFNNWTLAAAAYNCGAGTIRRSLEYQKVNNYFDLYLNTETSRYVFRITALKEILSNPEKYRYQFFPREGYQPIHMREIKISSNITDWSEWAIAHGVNYKILRNHNLWIRKHSFSNRLKRDYIIYLPAGNASK